VGLVFLFGSRECRWDDVETTAGWARDDGDPVLLPAGHTHRHTDIAWSLDTQCNSVYTCIQGITCQVKHNGNSGWFLLAIDKSKNITTSGIWTLDLSHKIWKTHNRNSFGWADRETDGQTDRQTDRQTDIRWDWDERHRCCRSGIDGTSDAVSTDIFCWRATHQHIHQLAISHPQ